MKSCSNRHASCTSPLITVKPIAGSHGYAITYTLGWDDGTFLAPKGMTYDYYAKCEEVLLSFGITNFLFHAHKSPLASLIP